MDRQRYQCPSCGRVFLTPRICKKCWRFSEVYVPRNRHKKPRFIDITMVDGSVRRIITQK